MKRLPSALQNKDSVLLAIDLINGTAKITSFNELFSQTRLDRFQLRSTHIQDDSIVSILSVSIRLSFKYGKYRLVHQQYCYATFLSRSDLVDQSRSNHPW